MSIEVVFCCFTNRCLLNYAPLLRYIQSEGGDVSLVLFPRLCDPDHAGLYTAPFPIRSIYPIDAQGNMLTGALDQVSRAIGEPDFLLLGSCNLGPERVLGALTRPKFVIGLQHGFYQGWEDYDSNPNIQMFGVFGDAFRQRLKKRSVTLGLPKLDLIPQLPDNPDGDIVFAAQSAQGSNDILRLLEDLQRASGKRVLVRPHPEHRGSFDLLRSSFEFLDPEQSLIKCLKRTALLVTTGSTVVLEALVANVPVAVLPEFNGSEYTATGLVASEFSAAAVVAAWKSNVDQQRTLRAFLQSHTGSSTNDRTERAYRSLLSLARPWSKASSSKLS